jgi:AraC-like DNA-binding protein
MASQTLTPFLRELHNMPGDLEGRARHEASEVFVRMGLTMDDVESFHVRLPHEVGVALLAMLTEVTGDTALALRAAARFELGDFEPYDYLCRHSANLGDSIRAARDYMPLVHDGIDSELVIEGDVTSWRNRLVPGLTPSPAINEFTTASLMASARRNTGLPLVAAEVTLMHSRPPHADQIAEYFGSPVRFDAADNGFVMPTVGLELPLPGADLVLGRVLRRHADDLLRSLPARLPFTHSVTNLIVRELELSGPALKNIAHLMRMSQSTLRRRLAEEGRTHSEIVDAAREHLARRYLENGHASLSDVAQRLGFAHPPAFHRAFKRWTGMTPAQYRSQGVSSTVSSFLKSD